LGGSSGVKVGVHRKKVTKNEGGRLEGTREKKYLPDGIVGAQRLCKMGGSRIVRKPGAGA